MSDIPSDELREAAHRLDVQSANDAVEAARKALADAEAEYAALPPEAPIEEPPLPIEEAPALPTKHCAKCNRQVVPRPKGNCPICGRILPGVAFNQADRQGVVNQARRDEILALILDEYRPHTVVLKLRCTHLATTYMQLESTKAGTPAFQRLIADSTKLRAELDAACRGASAPSIASLTEAELIVKLESLLASVRESQRNAQAARVTSSEASERQSEAVGASNATAPASIPAVAERASPSPSVIRHSQPELTPEEFERRAAKIRADLGWDVGVYSEQTGYRYRE